MRLLETMQPVRCGIVFLTVLLLAAATYPLRDQRWVGRFSAQQPGVLPSDWQIRVLQGKEKQTHYSLVQDEGQTVLKAESSNTASAVFKKVDIDPGDYPYVEWSWKIDTALRQAKWADKKGDDFPARLFLLFKNNGGFFSFLQTDSFSGPALNYVFASGIKKETLTSSPYSGRVMMIAVGPEENQVGTWVRERRNVVEDFKRAFGENPGKIVAVALMTDTDDTATQATSYYGDIRFFPAERP